MELLLMQVISAFSLMLGLIISMSWFYWKDSPLWLLLLGFFFLISGIVGVVFALKKAAEESND